MERQENGKDRVLVFTVKTKEDFFSHSDQRRQAVTSSGGTGNGRRYQRR